VFDQRVEGRSRWRLQQSALGGLAQTGFSLTEAVALHFSRKVAEQSVGGLLSADLARAFDKFDAALSPVRRFLDQLPEVLVPRGGHVAHTAPVDPILASRLLDAILHHTRIDMRYTSRSSGGMRTYRVEPARLVSTEDDLYLLAFVPAYNARRTFAVSRISDVALLDEHFSARNEDWDSTFAHSLGIHEGPPEHVEVWFSPEVADYAASRRWHPTQRARSNRDGSLTLALDVATDWALKRWILGFGAQARVLAPATLVAEVAADVRRLHDYYGTNLETVPGDGERPRATARHSTRRQRSTRGG
jgi:predicted DNA-binding transcriptional regulator YafY